MDTISVTRRHICGDGRDDVIFGGSGNDSLLRGAGEDLMFGWERRLWFRLWLPLGAGDFLLRRCGSGLVPTPFYWWCSWEQVFKRLVQVAAAEARNLRTGLRADKHKRHPLCRGFLVTVTPPPKADEDLHFDARSNAPDRKTSMTTSDDDLSR